MSEYNDEPLEMSFVLFDQKNTNTKVFSLQ